MRISHMIEQLEKIKAQYGDIPVSVFDPDKLSEGDLVETFAHIVTGKDSEGKPTCVVCDAETKMAFA